MQLELHALHANSYRGAYRMLLLAGLPRLWAQSTTELELPGTNESELQMVFGVKGGPVRLRPKFGPFPQSKS